MKIFSKIIVYSENYFKIIIPCGIKLMEKFAEKLPANIYPYQNS